MIITTSSWKGGTGKTTLNVLTAKILAERGKKVLIIDLDSNCAISQCYGRVFEDVTSMEFLSAVTENFSGVYPARENIDIIPGNIRNALFQNILDTQLRINLRRGGVIGSYDYIIIDPPGTWGSHARNAIFAADTLIIPGTCSRIDFEATRLFFNTLRDCGMEDKEIYICVNSYSARSNLPGVIDLYKNEFADFLLPFQIPCISSLKKLVDNVDYPLAPSVKKQLARYVDYITGDGPQMRRRKMPNLNYAKYAYRLRDYLSAKDIEVKDNRCRCFNPLHNALARFIPTCKVSRNAFYCPVCGVFGDIYDAVMLIENMPPDRKAQLHFLEKFFSRHCERAHCGGVFEKGWTDEEAMAEQKEDLPGVPLSERELVCDDCHKQFYEGTQKGDSHGV
jgi:cellulose biosynthesis protein BcsQ